MQEPENPRPRQQEFDAGALRAEVLEEVGKKCRRVAEEAKQRRPRAKYVALENIPRSVQKKRSVDVRSWKRRRDQAERRVHKRVLSRELQTKRPGLHVHRRRPYPESGEDVAGSESDSASEIENGSDFEPLEGQLDDADETAYLGRLAEMTTAELAPAKCQDLDEGFRLNRDVYQKLFDYQQQGVQWIWELHKQKAGGIIGDEMGLGKTAQVLSFLGGLHESGKYRPSLVLCPVTLLRHWLDEIRQWAAKLRACILHDSMHRSGGRKKMKSVIQTVRKSENGLLITTYEHLRIFSELLLPIDWGYAVLDEGHKIKNPDADITLLVKQVWSLFDVTLWPTSAVQLRTPHRLIITGSPVQNKLTELWSLFDFVFPGKLGTLPVFETEFGIPIQVGGYKNASRLSVSKAIKCASILRDIIRPYMLIRRKNQVNVHLPSKREHVLFCTLSEEQRSMYKAFIESPEIDVILKGKQNLLAGIDVMRKICNHPDLLKQSEDCKSYGEASRSGKLKITLEVLKLWKAQGDKVLVFAQTQMMLDILEFHLQQNAYMYYRMDGCTSVRLRDQYIKSFNSDPTVFAFLLTTKVGGLGVNLTGANRVLLYDPDWNPSVDVQARERAWRIGQQREVTIYRLITSGTIEEKIYQRQMFKQLLTDKVLKHASQKRLFSSKNIRDLFSLEEKNLTETEALLEGTPQFKGDSILEQLVEGGSIRSVLDQRAVDEAPPAAGRDPVSYQATVEAKQALDRMQIAGDKRSRFDVHFPTWTGRNGAAGAPPSFGRALEFGLRLRETQAAGVCQLKAPSSSDVLARLRMRQNVSESQDTAQPFVEAPSDFRLSSAHAETNRYFPHKGDMPERGSLEGVSNEELAEWRALVVEYFTQRGRVVLSDQLNTLAKRIAQYKRQSFRTLVLQLAHKIPGTRRWILHPHI